MPSLTRRFMISPRDFVRAGEVSIEIQGLLKGIGFPAEIISRACICAYEAEMNVVIHGGKGTATLTLDEDHIIIEVEDDGPGIEDIELAFQEGYSTAGEEVREMGFGAGMGLPNIRKNADTVELRSEKNKGAYLRMSFSVKRER